MIEILEKAYESQMHINDMLRKLQRKQQEANNALVINVETYLREHGLNKGDKIKYGSYGFYYGGVENAIVYKQEGLSVQLFVRLHRINKDGTMATRSTNRIYPSIQVLLNAKIND